MIKTPKTHIFISFARYCTTESACSIVTLAIQQVASFSLELFDLEFTMTFGFLFFVYPFSVEDTGEFQEYQFVIVTTS
jgi:hypothetical protein